MGASGGWFREYRKWLGHVEAKFAVYILEGWMNSGGNEKERLDIPVSKCNDRKEVLIINLVGENCNKAKMFEIIRKEGGKDLKEVEKVTYVESNLLRTPIEWVGNGTEDSLQPTSTVTTTEYASMALLNAFRVFSGAILLATL